MPAHRSGVLCLGWNEARHDSAFASSAMPDPDNIVFPGLKDRVVIVTGAGQGMGRVLAKSFASAGARAVIAELNEKKAAAGFRGNHENRWQALAVTTDVADPASIKQMVEVVEDEYDSHRCSDQQWRHLLDTGNASFRSNSVGRVEARPSRQS